MSGNCVVRIATSMYAAQSCRRGLQSRVERERRLNGLAQGSHLSIQVLAHVRSRTPSAQSCCSGGQCNVSALSDCCLWALCIIFLLAYLRNVAVTCWFRADSSTYLRTRLLTYFWNIGHALQEGYVKRYPLRAIRLEPQRDSPAETDLEPSGHEI